MKVLADFHHDDLFYSLQLLFENRLGWELYRPIGLEWYTEGYWNVYPHIDTAKQFLATDQATNKPKDIRGNPLSNRECLNANYTEADGIYYIVSPTKPDVVSRAITLQKFKDTQFDIIVSSIPNHIEPFNRLIAQFQPKAKHIFQVGNAWGHLPGVKNIMASTSPFSAPDINTCFYHQEFRLDWFKYEPPQEHKTVNSYIHWMNGKELIDNLRVKLPDFKFVTYGAGMEQSICATQDIANTMINSAFTWHYKPEGDGYGHVLHNSFACGRPVIIVSKYYTGKLGGQLLVPDKTCIEFIGNNVSTGLNNLAQNLRKYSHPDIHARMCEQTYSKFKETVNFDYEYQNILRPFLDRLV